MDEDAKYSRAKARIVFKKVSLGAHERVGSLEIAVEGEGVSIKCTISISREDAISINRAFHVWHQAVESMNGQVDSRGQGTIEP